MTTGLGAAESHPLPTWFLGAILFFGEQNYCPHLVGCWVMESVTRWQCDTQDISAVKGGRWFVVGPVELCWEPLAPSLVRGPGGKPTRGTNLLLVGYDGAWSILLAQARGSSGTSQGSFPWQLRPCGPLTFPYRDNAVTCGCVGNVAGELTGERLAAHPHPNSWVWGSGLKILLRRRRWSESLRRYLLPAVEEAVRCRQSVSRRR